MQYFRTDSPFNVFLMTFLARNVLFPWIILSQWMCMIFINLYYLNGKCSSRVSCFCVIKPLLYVTFNDIILLETRTFSWTLDYVAFQHKIACYTHTHTHAHAQTHTHKHTQAHTRTHRHTDTDTDTHAHTHTVHFAAKTTTKKYSLKYYYFQNVGQNGQ